jgi:FkbM family methyltransferase
VEARGMLGRLKRAIRRLLRPNLHRPDHVCRYEVLGTEYGGWPVVEGTVGPASIVYSVGLGEDISFDLALIQKSAPQIWGFDPTPKSRAWIEAQNLPPQFHFQPVGVGARDGEMTFYPPANENYVSFSAAPGQDQTRTPITAPVERLTTIVARLGHDRIDVLKMDIEGFEYDVLDDLLAGPFRPGLLLVEFHHGMYGIADAKTRDAVNKLRAAGYRLFYVSPAGREYGFRRA